MDRDEGWEIFDDALPFAGATYGRAHVRMVVIGLGGSDLLLVTPGGNETSPRWDELAKWGTPRFILAPNHFHNMGIPAARARFPEAKVVAHERACKRLRKKLAGVTVDDLSALESVLPAHVRLFSPPNAKQGETWVSVKTKDGTAWFVTDAIVNETRLPRGPVGLLMRVLGFKAELITNPFFKRFFLSDKAAYKAWVHAELDRDRPVLFVPSHGAPIRGDDLVDCLRAITDAA